MAVITEIKNIASWAQLSKMLPDFSILIPFVLVALPGVRSDEALNSGIVLRSPVIEPCWLEFSKSLDLMVKAADERENWNFSSPATSSEQTTTRWMNLPILNHHDYVYDANRAAITYSAVAQWRPGGKFGIMRVRGGYLWTMLPCLPCKTK